MPFLKLCGACKHEAINGSEFPCSKCRGTGSEWQPKEDANTYWKRIEALAERQRRKGMSKYGYGLEMNPDGILKRLTHLEEELIDALMYCEWIKEHFNETE